MDKNSIRAEMRIRRKAVSPEEKSAAEAMICGKLKSHMDTYGTETIVAAYLASQDEICLDSFIAQALRDGRQVVAPRWNGHMYELARLRGLDGTCLRRGPMGIREPVAADMVLPEDVGVWLVPGLAFTADGRRLGYGGGWYDRLLASASADSEKLGIAYRFQVFDALPHESHDIPLTAVVCNDLVDYDVRI